MIAWPSKVPRVSTRSGRQGWKHFPISIVILRTASWSSSRSAITIRGVAKYADTSAQFSRAQGTYQFVHIADALIRTYTNLLWYLVISRYHVWWYIMGWKKVILWRPMWRCEPVLGSTHTTCHMLYIIQQVWRSYPTQMWLLRIGFGVRAQTEIKILCVSKMHIC